MSWQQELGNLSAPEKETKAVARWDDWGVCTNPLQITNQLSVSFAVIEQYIQGKRSL